MAKGTGNRLQATGILLAGGKSSRMRRNKAFLELNGEPLVARSLHVLREIFAEVLISSNDPHLYATYGVRVVPDLVQGRGPVGGLQAGLKAASFDYVFFVACDMPFLEPKLIRLLSLWAGEYDVVVPQIEGKLNPLHAFYGRTCLPYVEKYLEAGRLKIIDFYPECKVRYVGPEEMAQAFGTGAGENAAAGEKAAAERLEQAFLNVNTPEQWEKLIQARVSRRGCVPERYRY